MLRHFLNSKIHRATVTDANLNYVGSITIDETLMKESKIKEWQKVDILDINMGCPVPKIVNNHEGSYLLTQPKLVEQILTKMVKAIKKPVTIKVTKGL